MKARKLTRITTAMAMLAVGGMSLSMVAQDTTTPAQKPKHHQYKLIDLGTLGGPQSFLPFQGERSINNQGTLNPAMDTSTPDPFFPNGLGADGYVLHAASWRSGSVTDLGALPGSSSTTNWISDSGLIAGISENVVIDPDFGAVEFRAVYWKNGHIRDLGTLGGYESLAFAVNNQGIVVGCTENQIPDAYSIFCGGASQSRAFRWQNGVMHDLGTLGGNDAAAFYVNDSDQIAGLSYTNNVPNATTGVPTLDPFLWQDGKMIDLGSFGGTQAGMQGLNNRGQVVGESFLAGDVTYHPYLWDRGKLKDLGTLGGDWGQANALNEDGDVVGVSALPPGPHDHDAFLWRRGVMTDLGNLGVTSWGYKINSHDQVVGASAVDASIAAAFLWENGGPMVDLNGLVENSSGEQLVFGLGINDSGQIAATGYLPNGDWHAFTLIPDGDCDDHDYKVRLAASRINAASLNRFIGNQAGLGITDAPPARGIPGLNPGGRSPRSTIQGGHVMPTLR